MRRLRTWFVRLAGLVATARHDRDLAAELDSHLQLHIDDNIRAGMSPDEARRAALVRLGGVEAVKEAYRDRRGLPSMEALVRDVRYAMRVLRRSPTASAISLLTLTLGIGANTAIFTLVHAWVLKPLPFPEPERLVWLWESPRTAPDRRFDISSGDFVDWQTRNQVFEHVSAFKQYVFALTGSGSPERVAAQRVSADFFKTLGVKAAIGRDFTAEEGRPGANRVVMLTHEYWQNRFGGDPSLLGRSLILDSVAYDVIGILPSGFTFPLGDRADVWVPLALTPEQRQDRRDNWINPVARLKRGVTVDQARAAMASIADQIAVEHPNGMRTASFSTVAEAVADRSGSHVSWILLGVTSLVLLIACANVANLSLARAAERRREIALRLALGASRRHLARQFLAESMIVSIGAGVLGTCVAFLGVHWIVSLLPGTSFDRLPHSGGAEVDLPVLGFTMTVALLSGALFGLAPAFTASGVDPQAALRETRQASGSRRATRVRHAFVIGEVALAVVIMVGAGLLTGSLLRLYEINPGFTPERLLTTPLHLPQARYRSAAQVRAFFDEALGRISAIPGVVAAGAATQLPFGGFSSGVAFEVPNRIEGAPDEGTARWAAITPGYVATMQIPLVRGRLFDARDTPGSEPVGLINETLARRFFPNQDPLGRRLSTSDVPALTIVGVLRDVKYWKLNDTIDPELYQPEAQVADQRLSVVVRTAADSRAIAAAVREAVWSLDKDEPVPAMVTYEQMIDRRHAEARLATILVGLFAALALALSAMGIYGAVAYSVSRRTREIGIRLALGGTASGVQALVIRQGLFVVAIGVVVGLGAAAALTRVLANLLYDTSPTDPVTFVATATLLMGVAAIAAYVPALRAARVDPMASLRAD